jgi:hypothetical protein
MPWLKELLSSVRNGFRPDPWGPFDLQSWHDLPHVAGRPGTEADVRAGRAVFYLAGGAARATPHEMPLPVCAVHHEETGESHPVVIIQAERSEDRVIVGFRYPQGGNGVATLAEVELRVGPGERPRADDE